MTKLKGEIELAAKELLISKYVIALTGAGVSTESDIPDFRGPSGVWTLFEKGDYSGVAEMFEKLEGAKSNPSHHALAKLEEIGILKCLITQNIDNLHTLAGSRNVLEFHGNKNKSRCELCNERFDSSRVDEIEAHRRRCGGNMRSDIVMFGDPIPLDVLQKSFEEARKCDCVIVAGTSAVVYPAAQIPYVAKANGARIIEVNTEETELTYTVSDHFLKGKTGEILPSLVDEVERLKREGYPTF